MTDSMECAEPPPHLLDAGLNHGNLMDTFGQIGITVDLHPEDVRRIVLRQIPPVERKDDEFITMSDLKRERGWTDTSIKKFAPIPDHFVKNPHYKSAAPMRLYRVSRIREIEATPEFQDYMEKSMRRRQGAQQAIETKREKTMDIAWTMPIHVEVVPNVIDEAIATYNEWKIEHDDWDKRVSSDTDQNVLERIAVNHIRHNLTTYECHLYEIQGLVGNDEAYRILKGRVLQEIGAAYPELCVECKRQETEI